MTQPTPQTPDQRAAARLAVDAAVAAQTGMTIAQFAQLRRALSNRLVGALTGLFRGLGAWRDPDAERFVVQAVPLVAGSKRTMASITSVYIADQASVAAGKPVAPPPIPDSAVLNLRRVDPAVVYRRPFVTMRMALAKGEDFPVAVERGVNRLSQVVEGDMQQVHSSAARAAMQALPAAVAPSGWRRTLQGTVNCGMCVVASTQLYTVDTLNPMHPNCDCGVSPVFGPHPAVGPERTAEVKAAIEEITGGKTSRYSALRDLVVEHGELGPLLVRPKDHFTSEAELPS